MNRLNGIIGGVLTAMLSLTALTTAQDNNMVIDGSTTVGPIAKAFAEFYMRENKGVNIQISESGSGNGARSLINSSAHVGIMSRFMRDTEFKAALENGVMPVVHVVAMDGLPIIVHPSNPVKNMTIDQVQSIYTGKIKNWKEVGGPNQPIIMISRETNSGTYETFNDLVMRKEKIAANCEYVGSNGAVRQRVQSTPNAIGYAGLGFVDNTVRALSINGIAPTPRTVARGTYPIARALYMFTNGYPKLGSHLHAYVSLHLTPKGQEMIESIGFVPLTEY